MTFWLRPAFTLRVAKRFQQIVGFDRAMALASGALAALLPLAILCGSVLSGLGRGDVADHVVERYGLTGGGADSVKEVLAPPTGTDVGVDVLGAVFLAISLLSFSRAVQRMFEQTWELRPLSVRNTLNGLRWILGLAAYLIATAWLHTALDSGRYDLVAVAAVAPLTTAFLVWGGWVLSARRIAPADLVPFGAIAAVLTAAYSVGVAVYLPRALSSYANRYGSVGAVFATLSTLFGAMVVIVGAAAVGREVGDELGRIRRGERPPDDEVRREWQELVDEVRSRWRTSARRRSRGTGRGPTDDQGPTDAQGTADER
ncbi:YhjD/YihY/BrkB family envelope integrity protein [Kitasatospora cinereorecta]|uniref:YhjD/YihY/BrkB family envelope integrity protein n=1 Tax=Kitasatospora cinereorecta TaxID=285560 RepID=A0ABW0V768_9ACTN